jgi:mRNA interferase RelE/StbE
LLSNYRIFETDEFLRRLSRLDARSRGMIETKLREYVYPRLREQPFFGNQIRKLRGYEPDTWRYRIGSFRIFYAVNPKDRIVAMLTVDDRKDAYR